MRSMSAVLAQATEEPDSALSSAVGPGCLDAGVAGSRVVSMCFSHLDDTCQMKWGTYDGRPPPVDFFSGVSPPTGRPWLVVLWPARRHALVWFAWHTVILFEQEQTAGTFPTIADLCTKGRLSMGHVNSEWVVRQQECKNDVAQKVATIGCRCSKPGNRRTKDKRVCIKCNGAGAQSGTWTTPPALLHRSAGLTPSS